MIWVIVALLVLCAFMGIAIAYLLNEEDNSKLVKITQENDRLKGELKKELEKRREYEIELENISEEMVGILRESEQFDDEKARATADSIKSRFLK